MENTAVRSHAARPSRVVPHLPLMLLSLLPHLITPKPLFICLVPRIPNNLRGTSTPLQSFAEPSFTFQHFPLSSWSQERSHLKKHSTCRSGQRCQRCAQQPQPARRSRLTSRWLHQYQAGLFTADGDGDAHAKRLVDVQNTRLKKMDENGVAMTILSLTAPGIQVSRA